MLRRLLTIPGVVQINSWGGTTKEFDVEADPAQARGLQRHHAADHHGARQRQYQCRRPRNHHRPAVGQHSRHRPDRRRRQRRPDQGLSRRRHRERRPDPARMACRCGSRTSPRSRSAMCPGSASPAAITRTTSPPSIVVMGRTQHTNDVVAAIKAEVEKMNSDGSLPPGVKIVPYYDRIVAGRRDHAYGAANLVFGCLLVFLIQWIFLGDLRSAIIVGVNIPFALLFAHHHPGAAGPGRESAVDRRGRLRHHRRFRRDPGREYLPELPVARQTDRSCCEHLAEGDWGADPTSAGHGLSTASALDRSAAPDPGQRAAGRQGGLFSAAITVAAFVPLFTMQGVEGQIFGPMARTYGLRPGRAP